MTKTWRRAARGLSSVAVLLLFLSIATIGRGDGPRDRAARRARAIATRPIATRPIATPSIATPPIATPPIATRWHDAVSERGQHARGLYVGAGFVRQHGGERVVELARNARMNAVVIDMRDAEGRAHHDTQIPELRAYRTGWLGDTAALVRTLHDADIYAIARISCFADNRLPLDRPERAIQHVRHRRPWVSWGTGGTWLDPHHPENHRMLVELTREAEQLGFDEVQLDYVRFPVDDGTEFAHYPALTDEARPEILMRLLRAIDEATNIPLGVDVFGIAAYRQGDSSGLGQDLERWAQHVEVFTPMLYVNSMRNWRQGEEDRTFRLVFNGTRRLRERLGPQPVIRPFLQAFARGADEFDTRFIHDQLRASRRAGADGFLFWHPGHAYGMVRRAMQVGGTRSLVPFPIPDRVRDARLRP